MGLQSRSGQTPTGVYVTMIAREDPMMLGLSMVLAVEVVEARKPAATYYALAMPMMICRSLCILVGGYVILGMRSREHGEWRKRCGRIVTLIDLETFPADLGNGR